MLEEEGTARAAISPVVSPLDGFHKVHSTGGGGGCLRISVFGECLNMTQNARWMWANEAKTGERLVQSHHRQHIETPSQKQAKQT